MIGIAIFAIGFLLLALIVRVMDAVLDYFSDKDI